MKTVKFLFLFIYVYQGTSKNLCKKKEPLDRTEVDSLREKLS